ncbi:hypothetical protein PRIPAC_79500, partial [Pristionchus pacificus]
TEKKMVRLLLTVIALVCVSQATFVLDSCGCGTGVETFPQSTAAYCPTSSYPKCNSSMLVEKSCTLTCPYSRSTIAYRNGTATFITTDSITCSDGVLTNGVGAKITNLMRPTCAFLAPCESCPITYEATKCPTGSSCNAANYKKGIDATDGCDRITCDKSATLTFYDSAKAVVPFSTQKLYCTVANKWQNYSLNGNIAGGTALPTTALSANCILPLACETCSNPNFILAVTQLPDAFKTGYNTFNPTVNKPSGNCATVTCPNGYQLMGFVGTAGSQTGQNWTDQNYMKCNANGQWSNGDLGYTPQDIKVQCMQKQTPCPPIDNVLGNTFNVACNETTKVSTLTCPIGKKLSMRYTTQTSTVRYDRATFFAGKGWLAHGCDATASLFTTVSGAQINGVCV